MYNLFSYYINIYSEKREIEFLFVLKQFFKSLWKPSAVYSSFSEIKIFKILRSLRSATTILSMICKARNKRQIATTLMYNLHNLAPTLIKPDWQLFPSSSFSQSFNSCLKKKKRVNDIARFLNKNWTNLYLPDNSHSTFQINYQKAKKATCNRKTYTAKLQGNGQNLSQFCERKL